MPPPSKRPRELRCGSLRRFPRFFRASAWFPVCEALANILDQPAACRARTRTPLANHMDRHGQPFALTDFQPLEPPRANVLVHHVPGMWHHPKPARRYSRRVEKSAKRQMRAL